MLCIYIYIYIFIHIEREREGEHWPALLGEAQEPRGGPLPHRELQPQHLAAASDYPKLCPNPEKGTSEVPSDGFSLRGFR